MYFQSEDSHGTRIVKREKVNKNKRFKDKLKMTFLLIFYADQRRLKP